ncbi:oxidoreductase family protein [Alteromonas ponticola]|uniref:DUF1679 domain-containing protein n=1 Tax=Alteromonas ponticola TaxID=2720613 RepID=A0ABX1QZR1_9ALTE|nr:oxidoreductase family protein [Alteromonas ponticola]NMH58686.1 DUF1679 domain-containing protein [Alteromonas ponticola]
MSTPNHFVDTLKQHLPLLAHNDIELIQPLWNDYGYCVRCVLQHGGPVVVKIVELPQSISQHPKGWATQHSHLRKCRSFDVEMHFYRYFAKQTSLPPLPQPYRLKKLDNGWLFALADLKDQGFIRTTTELSVNQCFTVLDWLANFHARFLHHPAEGLWQQGGYWHLSTREDEYKQTQDGELKAAAHRLDELQRACAYQTIIHGDAKVANFCFSADFARCAAVDFQYPGCAPGIVDVAYFIGSALSDEDQLACWEACLDRYFCTLAGALSASQEGHQIKQLERAWRNLYPIACADFHRFLAGWSPQHWKINEHLQQQTALALAIIEKDKC